MRSPRILIVDDHVQVRRVLRSGLETFTQALEIVDVPSGEEALVVAASKPVDLLISDLCMAGMTGLELKQKIQNYSPGLKVFLITGITDPAVRQEAIEAGAEAFFLKPVDMGTFLQTVATTLGLEQSGGDQPDQPDDLSPPEFSVHDRINALRQELEAISVVLIDDQARVIFNDGDLPEALLEASLLTALLIALKSSLSISNSLDHPSPDSLMVFPGGSFNLALAHVGQKFALMIVSEKKLGTGFLQMVTPAIRRAAHDLALRLSDINQFVESQENLVDVSSGDNEISGIEIDNNQIEALLDKPRQETLRPEDVDAFWNAVTQEEWIDEHSQGTTLSYDQALQLGLITHIGSEGENDQPDQPSSPSEQ